MRGEILVFVHVAEKLWTMCVEMAPSGHTPRVVETRERQGYRHIAKTFAPPPVESTTSFSSRRVYRQAKPEPPKKVERTDLDLVSGRVFELQLTGDVQIASDDPGRFNTGIRFEERLEKNYRHFIIEPTSIEKCCPLTAQLRCYVTGAEGATCVRTFDIDFELEAVKAYLDKGVEAVVEPPVLEPIKSEVTITDPRLKLISDAGDAALGSDKMGKKSPAPRPPKRNSRATVSLNETSKKYEVRSRASTIARLTKPMKPPREGLSSSLSSYSFSFVSFFFFSFFICEHIQSSALSFWPRGDCFYHSLFLFYFDIRFVFCYLLLPSHDTFFGPSYCL